MLLTVFCVACSTGSAPASRHTASDDIVSIPTTAEALTYSPEQTTIATDEFRFNPDTVEVAAGAKVEWENTNTRRDHRPVANGSSPIFRSYLLHHETPGSGLVSAFAFTFTRTGAYRYHCEIHPSMTGTITVR